MNFSWFIQSCISHFPNAVMLLTYNLYSLRNTVLHYSKLSSLLLASRSHKLKLHQENVLYHPREIVLATPHEHKIFSCCINIQMLIIYGYIFFIFSVSKYFLCTTWMHNSILVIIYWIINIQKCLYERL